MNERVKITQGMALPGKYAESMEELQGECDGISLLLDQVVSRSAMNRAKIRRLWELIDDEFDLDGKRWKASYSPKTELKWVFEILDSHGLDTRNTEDE